MKKKHPTAGIGELGKLMGEMWSKLSEKEKLPYQKKADKDKERYNAEKEAYVPPTPPMPKDWAEAQDPNTGKTYYYNRKTSETTWSRPEAPPEKPKKKKKDSDALERMTYEQLEALVESSGWVARMRKKARVRATK